MLPTSSYILNELRELEDAVLLQAREHWRALHSLYSLLDTPNGREMAEFCLRQTQSSP